MVLGALLRRVAVHRVVAAVLGVHRVALAALVDIPVVLLRRAVAVPAGIAVHREAARLASQLMEHRIQHRNHRRTLRFDTRYIS